MFIRFFKCAAKAALANVKKALLENLPFGNAAYDFAQDLVKYWREAAPNSVDRANELQQASVAAPEMVLNEAKEAVKAVASDQSEELQLVLVDYLTQVPSTIRRSLSRPADLTGTTVPHGLALNTAEEVLPFLSLRAPHKELYAGKHFNDWELTERLGSGGFGEVWKAVHPHLAPAAFKFCTDPVAAKSLRNEAALLGRVEQSGRHPGIVALRDTSLNSELPYLRCDFVAGGELTSLIQDWKRLAPAVRANRSVELMFRLATIVGFAHRLSPPIVHRDLKPANVLIQPSEKKGRFTLRIADFGIGGIAVAQARTETQRGTTPGEFLTMAVRGSCTPLYASPQQMRGNSPDPRDDVFSLGVMWYQMLVADVTASRPGGTKWPTRLVEQGVENRLVEMLEKCLEDAREDRFADAASLAQELRGPVKSGRDAVLDYVTTILGTSCAARCDDERLRPDGYIYVWLSSSPNPKCPWSRGEMTKAQVLDGIKETAKRAAILVDCLWESADRDIKKVAKDKLSTRQLVIWFEPIQLPGGDPPITNGGGRKKQTMKVLEERGLLREGTEIEVMPDAIGEDSPRDDPTVFKARIGNTHSQKSVIWMKDQTTYSLTEHSCKLEEFGLWWIRGKTFELWRIVGQTDSMWDQADKLREAEAPP